MENNRLESKAAQTSLDQVQAGRSAAARRVVTPWWFHPLLGLALAGMLAALSLRGPAAAVVFVLSLLAQVGLYALYRRLTGLWVNTWHVSGMRQVTAVATGSYLVLALVAVALEGGGVRGAAAVAGAVLGVLYVVYWRWVDRRLAQLWSQPE